MVAATPSPRESPQRWEAIRNTSLKIAALAISTKSPGLTSFVMPSRQMQDFVKLGLTSGCHDDRGTVDETTR
jgi:hypothetical protein